MEKGLPDYIGKKIDRLNSMLEQANSLKLEIEAWAKKKGANTFDTEWYESIMDDYSSVKGISKERFHDYLTK